MMGCSGWRAALARACVALFLSVPITFPGDAVASPPYLEVEEAPGFLNVKLNDRIVRLETLVVKPKGVSAKLPVALITHGKAPERSEMNALRPAAYAGVARDFAERGWLAAVVMRRGFGRSDGPFPGLTNCETDRAQEQFTSDASELAASLLTLRARPDADPARAIAVGVSAGGAAVMALAANPPEGLKGVINVSGGLTNESCEEKSGERLVEAMHVFGAKSRVPQLWVYADNDKLFPAALVNRMHEKALAAGADIRRVSMPRLDPDGHNLFFNSMGRRFWLREADQSLREWDLPTFDPALVLQWMKALDVKNRSFLEAYLSAPGHKALAINPEKRLLYYRFASSDQKTASDSATADCMAKEGPCKLGLIGMKLAD